MSVSVYRTLISRKIIGNLSPEEELELSDWIALSPANKNLYQKLIAAITHADYTKRISAIYQEIPAWRSVKFPNKCKGQDARYILEGKCKVCCCYLH
jgi:hypothetical protein